MPVAADPILWHAAIKTLYDATVALTDVSNGLFYDLAPQPTTYPYVTFRAVSNVPQDVFGGDSVQQIRVQFTAWDSAKSHVSMMGIATALVETFQDATLTLSDGTRQSLMSFAKIVEIGPRREEEDLIRYDVDFMLSFWRTAS